MTPEIPTVACMKWGTLYGPEYVNRLHAGVARHLARPFRFVCFTDDAQGLDPAIDARPLPDTGAGATRDSRWRKLALLRDDLPDWRGTVLFLDLDVVIVADLAPFLDTPGAFCAIRDADLFRPRPLRRWFRPARNAFYARVANTSVFRFEAGAHADALARYVTDHDAVIAGYRNEQEFLSDHLHAQSQLQFWPAAWCASFKNGCVPRGLASFHQNPQCPAGTRIVVFAGRPKMSDVLAGRGGRWYRRIGPAPWLVAAWTAGDDHA